MRAIAVGVRSERRPASASAVVTLATALAVAWLAYDAGTYSLPDRAAAGMVVWWALGLAVALGVLPLGGLGRWTLAAAGLLATFAAWTAVSVAWAPSAEGAFDDLTRVLLYLGVFLLMALVASAAGSSPLADGIAVGIVAVLALALADRFFPGFADERDVAEFAPGTEARLAYPIGYWNGLAILVALALPLLLRRAAGGEGPLVRGIALAPVPAIAAAVYLASSRTAFAVLAVGAIAFLLVTPRRWAAAAALALGGLGAALALAMLRARTELVDGPLESAAAESQGRSAALLLLAICAATAAAYGLGVLVLAGRLRIPRAVSSAAAAVAAAVAIGALALADPVERFSDFRQPPVVAAAGGGSGALEEHLLSTAGSGRWQMWASGIDAFEREPLSGIGAGGFEPWWAQHGTVAGFARDAHSLYVETLAELGVVGLVLLLGFLAVGLVGGVALYRAAVGETRILAAALLATTAAFATGAAADWIWELAAVGGVGVAVLALCTTRSPGVRSVGLAPRLVGAAVAFAIVVLLAIPFLTQAAIEDSRAALTRGDVEEARRRALDARDVQPWAASPHLQLALVEERAGDLAAARRSMARALARAPEDWRLWLISTRIETKAGRIAAARVSLARARALNPRSPALLALQQAG